MRFLGYQIRLGNSDPLHVYKCDTCNTIKYRLSNYNQHCACKESKNVRPLGTSVESLGTKIDGNAERSE